MSDASRVDRIRLPGLSASFPAHNEEDNVEPLLGALEPQVDVFNLCAKVLEPTGRALDLRGNLWQLARQFRVLGSQFTNDGMFVGGLLFHFRRRLLCQVGGLLTLFVDNSAHELDSLRRFEARSLRNLEPGP